MFGCFLQCTGIRRGSVHGFGLQNACLCVKFLDPALFPGVGFTGKAHDRGGFHPSPLFPIAPGFKNKTRYTPYVSPESLISHIARNKGNIERQCSIYNVLSIKNITLDSKQRKDNSDSRVKTPIPQGQLTG